MLVARGRSLACGEELVPGRTLPVVRTPLRGLPRRQLEQQERAERAGVRLIEQSQPGEPLLELAGGVRGPGRSVEPRFEGAQAIGREPFARHGPELADEDLRD